MKLKKKLFFHIGWPKCMSTSIQSGLCNYAKKNKNIAVITNSNTNADVNIFSIKDYFIAGDIKKSTSNISGLMKSIEKDTLVISDENFFHFSFFDLKYLIKSLSENFDETHILLICRNQRDFFNSQYGQWTLSGNSLGSFDFFVRLNGLLQNASLLKWIKFCEDFHDHRIFFLEDEKVVEKVQNFFGMKFDIPNENVSFSTDFIKFAAIKNLYLEEFIDKKDLVNFWFRFYNHNKVSINKILADRRYDLFNSETLKILNDAFKYENNTINSQKPFFIPKKFFLRFEAPIEEKKLNKKKYAKLQKIFNSYIAIKHPGIHY
jgi:hypothetical protein